MITHYEVISVSHLVNNNWINTPYDKYKQIYQSENGKDKKEEVYTYAKFVIETGKKHQIRVLCNYALQNPIFGDTKYGFETNKHSPLFAK